MAKYKTYGELAEAFKSGELDEHYYLMLDKGGNENSLSYFNPNLSDVENDEKNDELRNLFDQYEHKQLPIEQLLTHVGIRWQWC